MRPSPNGDGCSAKPDVWCHPGGMTNHRPDTNIETPNADFKIFLCVALHFFPVLKSDFKTFDFSRFGAPQPVVAWDENAQNGADESAAEGEDAAAEQAESDEPEEVHSVEIG